MSRGPAFAQRINDDVADQVLFTNNTLGGGGGAGGFTGSASTAVLCFNAVGTLTGPFGVNETTTAADGTFWQIVEPGVYSVELTVSQTGAVTNVWGLGFNQTLPVVAVTFATAATHVLQLDSNAVAPEVASSVITGVYRISQTLARGTARVRGLAAASGGGVPTGVVAANCAIRITKIWDVAF